MANNSLMVPNSGIITQPVAWKVQEALHALTLNVIPILLKAPPMR